MPCYSTVALQEAIENTAGAYLWSIGYDYPDPVGMLAPLLDWGTWFYRDAELERLLNRASSADDPDERLAASREFERIWIGEQAAVVPLSYNDRLLWRRPWVNGLWANGLAKATFAEAIVRR
jgi:ABC-type transport system substrate-binding protein